MNTTSKLDYIAGKLGLIPAFGDSIGRSVNKAELSLCQTYARDALATHDALLAALMVARDSNRVTWEYFDKEQRARPSTENAGTIAVLNRECDVFNAAIEQATRL